MGRKGGVSAVVCPVKSRHRSTANCRATATTAFLRAAALPLASPSTGIHLRRARYSGCQRIIRHTISTSIARTRGLPLLLTLPPRRLPPLLCSRGQRPDGTTPLIEFHFRKLNTGRPASSRHDLRDQLRFFTTLKRNRENRTAPSAGSNPKGQSSAWVCPGGPGWAEATVTKKTCTVTSAANIR